LKKVINCPCIYFDQITVGDIVGLFKISQDQADLPGEPPSGIVTQVSPTTVSVAFEEGHDTLGLNDHDFCNLIKLANDITHRRLKK